MTDLDVLAALKRFEGRLEVVEARLAGLGEMERKQQDMVKVQKLHGTSISALQGAIDDIRRQLEGKQDAEGL